MFEDSIIVQSAISAFNNAALIAPAFLWSAVLTAPLYALVWMFGDKIADKIGWNRTNLLNRASLWTAIITFGWIVLFSGNYGVLRDDMSTLPFMVAAIIFVTTMFIGSHLSNISLFSRKNLPYVALVVLALGLSDMHAWWGPILQICAAFCGVLIGRFAKSEMRDVPGILLIIMAATTTILMQPEFFRFGQLGNLTWVHLVAIILMGAIVAATVAVRNIKPSGKIHQSAYVKIKWMVRFVVVLGLAVFVMTESVPVFLGTFVAMFVLFALSVWHSDKVSVALSDKLYALAILTFGIIITMPVITSLGVILLANASHGNIWDETKRLL